MSVAISRGTWGAIAGVGSPAKQGLGLVVVHHFASPDVPAAATQAKEMEALRSVEKTHAAKGWAGIGYNFVIFGSGRAYEGRGWGRVGAHAEGQNSKSVGICFGWNGDVHQLTPEAIATARDLLAEGVKLGHLVAGFELDGHRDYSQTSCPGARIDPVLEQLRPGAPFHATAREAEIRDALAIIEDQVERIRGAL